MRKLVSKRESDEHIEKHNFRRTKTATVPPKRRELRDTASVATHRRNARARPLAEEPHLDRRIAAPAENALDVAWRLSGERFDGVNRDI